MCAPSPPPAPNYTAAAQAQGQANVDTAKVQGMINNPNVVNPYGTQTVTWGGAFDQAGYDAANQKYQQALKNYNATPYTTSQNGLQYVGNNLRGPAPTAPTKRQFTQNPDQPTLTQTLSPEQQALYDQSTATQQQLGKVAGQGAQALQGVVGKPVDFSSSPAAPVPGKINQDIVNAMMQRPQADYARAVDQNQSDLRAAGIPVGSKASNTQSQLLGRQLTDAQTQAELAGVNAGNTEFNQAMAARTQANTENLTARDTPINEITSLMSGSQVSNPFTTPGYAQNTQVQASPLYQATQDTGAWNQGLYNVGAAQAGNLQSGLFGLAGAGVQGASIGSMMKGSDRRIKRAIRRIGTHPLGIGLYRFSYKARYVSAWGAGRHVGVMADEVLLVKPEAVSRHPDGYLLVDYARLA